MAIKDEKQLIGPLGVIDLGAHSVRLEIVQPLISGFETLENISFPVPLGPDVFRTGKISIENSTLVERIFDDFKRVLNEYDVHHYVAVATSAVREAQNRDLFLQRIHQHTGLDLEVLEGPAEIRLIFLAVAEALKNRNPISSGNSIIFTIGTGSSQLSFLRNGLIQHADTIRLGTLRLAEEQQDQKLSPKRLNKILDTFVAEIVSGVARISASVKPQRLVAVGGPVRGLLALDRSRMPQKVGTLSRQRFEELYSQLSTKSPVELVSSGAVSDTVAKSLEPCCLMLEHLFNITNADRIEIPMINTRDALTADLVRQIRGEPDPFIPHIRSAAKALGERYRCDSEHAAHVRDYALALYDQLIDLHALPPRWRLLLEVAAEIHDVGLFISGRAHHKHSYYLIKNSSIPGITATEQELLAVVARYHRKAMPKSTHQEYNRLTRTQRVEVSKAAAILRVADALDRSHQGKIKSLRARLGDKGVTLRVQAPSDLTFEPWALNRKSNLFKEVFGCPVTLVRGGAR